MVAMGYSRFDLTGRPLPRDPGRDAELERLRKENEKLRAEAREDRSRLHDLSVAGKRLASFMQERTSERRRLAMHYAITRALSDAENLEEAAPRVLGAFGQRFGWALGVLWVVDETAGRLRCAGVWRTRGAAPATLQEACRRASLGPGAGLAGRVWTEKQPVWIEDLRAEGDPEGDQPLRSEAVEEGFHASFAFPIRNGRFHGVVQLLGAAEEAPRPDEDLIRTADIIGRQIGQFVERREAERERDLLLLHERKAHAEAERAREQTATILESIADAFYALDAHRRFTYVNREAEKLWGKRREELIGKKMWDVFPRAVGSRPHEAIERAFETGEATSFESASVVVGRWISGRAYPAPGGGVSVYFRDTSERKEAEVALRSSEARYRGIFEFAGASIWQQDLTEVEAALDRLREQGVRDFRAWFAEHPEFVTELIGMMKTVDVNETTVRMFGGHDKRELMRSLHAVFTPETMGPFTESMVAFAERRALFESEIVLRTLQGERRDMLIATKFPPPGEAPDNVLMSLMDITEHKRAERERDRSRAGELEARAEAEVAQKRLAFYAGAREERQIIGRELHDRVAHSMAVVRQCLELHEVLKERDPEAAKAKIEVAREEAKISLNSTRDLSMMLRRSEVEEGLRKALSDLLETTVPGGVRYEVRVEGDEGLIPTHVGNQLYLILREAVRNAASHSACESVSVGLVITPHGVVGRVEDDGRGFERDGAARPGAARFGVGLRSMRERAALVGGSFDALSPPGGGARIEVRVPLENGAQGTGPTGDGAEVTG